MSVLKFFVFFVFSTFSITAQDAPSRAPAASTTGGELELKKVIAEVEAQRQILDQISRSLAQFPVAEGLRKLDAATAKSQESLQTISSLGENIRKIETLVEHIPQKVVEAGETSKQGDLHTTLTSHLTTLQTSVKSQQTTLEDLHTKLTIISENTKGLEQLTKAQKNSAKQTELLEKILTNQDAILKNQNKIISKLDRTLGETLELYYGKIRNGAQDVIKFISDIISSEKGSPAAKFKKNATALLNQAATVASKTLNQGQDLVVKSHSELSNYLQKNGVPDPYHVYAATSILTIPLSLFALLIVSLAFKILRILGSIIFYPCYCCFRRRSRPVEDGESKKRKSSEVDRDQTASSKPPGKKQNTTRK